MSNNLAKKIFLVDKDYSKKKKAGQFPKFYCCRLQTFYGAD
jgi:hypothetical protein